MKIITTNLAHSSITVAILTLISGLAFSQQLRPQSLPAFEDYVVSLDAPGTEKFEYYDISSGQDYYNGAFIPSKSARAHLFFDDLSPIRLEIIVYEDEIDLEQWVQSREDLADEIFKIAPDDVSRKKIFDSDFNQVMGQTTHFRYLAPTTVYDGDDFVKQNFRKPVGKEYAAVFDGRAVVELKFMHDSDTEINPAQEAMIDRVASSIGVRYEELFDSFRETEYFSTPSGNRLSIKNYMSGNIDMQVHVDWIANETNTINAEHSDSQLGQIVVEITPFDAGAAGGVTPQLTILIEGLPDGRLSPRTYKRKGDEVLGRYVQKPKRLDRNDVSAMFMEAHGYPHCVAEPHRKVQITSEGISATTYTGQDASGQDIKVRHYSGGGSYLACNYVFVASPQYFDQAIETVETMLGTLAVEILGPWHSAQ